MRQMMAVLMISAALIISGISATTIAAGQLTSHVWADGGGGGD